MKGKSMKRSCRADGGKVGDSGWDKRDDDVMKDKDADDVYAGGKSNVAKEARKRGGKVEGEMKKARLDRPGRKRGGGVGADTSPLSSAARTSDRRDGRGEAKGTGGE